MIMNKTAFIFPGQGSQKAGMGKDFYEGTKIGKEIFYQAGEAVGLDLKALCFEENEDINITEYTQVCLLTTSIAMLEVLRENGIKADMAAGLSLGEYPALVAAGVFLCCEDSPEKGHLYAGRSSEWSGRHVGSFRLGFRKD